MDVVVSSRTGPRARLVAAGLVALAVVAGTVMPGAPGASLPRAAAQEGPTVTTQVVTSFDGTPIVTTLFVPPGVTADRPAPLVLRTHGWGGTGQRSAGGFVGRLVEAGYVVLTWDQRGFGCSGGEVAIDKPELEGRDVSALIDWAVAHAPVAVDAGGDPLVGMTGGSYAGGIQTATAAFDPRIDAIAPEISWFDLRYSLYSGQVPNQGWAAVLYAAGLATATGQGLDPSCPTFPQEGGLHPAISQAFVEGATLGTLSQPSLDFLGGSSLAVYGQAHPVTVPTLVVQGSTDTLFDLTDGYRIFDHVRSHGAPARFLVYCGGHVACPPGYADAGDGAHVGDAVLAWLARYLDGDASVEVGAPVEYRTNEGVWRQVDDLPAAGPGALAATGSGSVASVPALDVPEPGALPDLLAITGGELPAVPLIAAQLSPSGDPRAMTVEVAHAGDGPLELLGIPEVSLDVDGVGIDVVLLAKLVDREAGHVVNLQEGAVRASLLDGPVTVEVPMPGVAYTLPAGHHLDLQVTTASLMHANARLPAQAEVTARVVVPTLPHPDAPSGPTPPVGPTDPSPAAEPPDPVPATGGDPGAPGAVPAGPASPATLPATGPSPGPVLPLLALAAALLAWQARRRPTSPDPRSGGQTGTSSNDVARSTPRAGPVAAANWRSIASGSLPRVPSGRASR